MKKIILMLMIFVGLFLIGERLYFSIFPLPVEKAKIIADNYIKEKVENEVNYIKSEHNKTNHVYDFSYGSECCEYTVLVDDIYGKVELEIFSK